MSPIKQLWHSNIAIPQLLITMNPIKTSPCSLYTGQLQRNAFHYACEKHKNQTSAFMSNILTPKVYDLFLQVVDYFGFGFLFLTTAWVILRDPNIRLLIYNLIE